MQTIIYLRNYQEHKKGKKDTVSNNEAHSLIDAGFAQLFINRNLSFPGILEDVMQDKMLRADSQLSNQDKKEKKGHYQIKSIE